MVTGRNQSSLPQVSGTDPALDTFFRGLVPEHVHSLSGRSRDRLRQIDCSRLCGGCYHMAADEMVPTWPVLSTPIELSAAVAARQEWHDGELGLDPIGLVSR